MSLQTPTTQDLADTIVAQIGASLSQTIPIFPKAFIRVLAKVLAGVVIILYKYCSYIFLQMFVAHASMEETTIGNQKIIPLVRWGQLIGVGTPTAATRAQLVVSVPVTVQTGTLKAGAKLQRTSTGVIYQTLVDVPLNASSVQAVIQASSKTDDPDSIGAGAIGNLSAGDVISFVSPYPNVATDCTVVSQTVQGADAQDPDDYRAKVLRRCQARPQGGAYADYRAWAEGVAGIVHAYPYAASLPGYVDVYIEADAASSGSADGIPTSAQITAVADAIEVDDAGDAKRRPVGAAVTVRAITRSPFDVTVVGLNPSTADSQQLIISGLDEFFRSREPYIKGLSVLPREDSITRAGVSGVVDAIVSANGLSANDILVGSGSLYVLAPGEKAKLGSVSFV